MRLEKFTVCRVKVVQLKVVFSPQRESEPLGFPPPPPQNVLAETSGTGANIGKIQQLRRRDSLQIRYVNAFFAVEFFFSLFWHVYKLKRCNFLNEKQLNFIRAVELFALRV